MDLLSKVSEINYFFFFLNLFMISTFKEDFCFLVKYIGYESLSGSSIAFYKKLGPMNILF